MRSLVFSDEFLDVSDDFADVSDDPLGPRAAVDNFLLHGAVPPEASLSAFLLFYNSQSTKTFQTSVECPLRRYCQIWSR